MPSPVGHILGAAAIYLAATSGSRGSQHSKLTIAAVLLGGIVPDLDFVPGVLIGDPSAFHHGISHSAGFALFFGTVVFLVLRYFQHSDIATRAALMAALAYGFHAVLDAVSVGEGAKAVPLFWPFTPHEFGINLDLFGHFHHDGLVDGVWSIVRRENVSALTREVAVLGILVLLVQFWRMKGKTAMSSSKKRSVSREQ